MDMITGEPRMEHPMAEYGYERLPYLVRFADYSVIK